MASMDERIAALEARVMKLEAARPAPAAAAPAPAGGVDAGDLDDDRGNYVVRKDPTRWKGQSYAGKRLSECTPEFLDCLAGLCDWKAGKNDEEPGKEKYAHFERKDAARARGWAARLRAGWKPAEARAATNGHPAAYSSDADEDSGLPF